MKEKTSWTNVMNLFRPFYVMANLNLDLLIQIRVVSKDANLGFHEIKSKCQDKLIIS